MPDEVQLSYQFTDLQQLENAIMPFVHDGGVFIPTENHFHLSDAVRVTLTLPKTNHTFSFSGEVIWITPKSDAHTMGIGVQCNSDEGEAFRKAARELLQDLKEHEDDVSHSDTM